MVISAVYAGLRDRANKWVMSPTVTMEVKDEEDMVCAPVSSCCCEKTSWLRHRLEERVYLDYIPRLQFITEGFRNKNSRQESWRNAAFWLSCLLRLPVQVNLSCVVLIVNANWDRVQLTNVSPGMHTNAEIILNRIITSNNLVSSLDFSSVKCPFVSFFNF